MKHAIKALLIAVLVATVLSSCALFGGLFATELTIRNDTSFELDIVSWNGFSFGPSSVYDSVLGYYVDGFEVGDSETQEVDPGSDSISFYFTTGGSMYTTVDVIDVSNREKERFTLFDSTLVTSGITTMTLGALLESQSK